MLVFLDGGFFLEQANDGCPLSPLAAVDVICAFHGEESRAGSSSRRCYTDRCAPYIVSNDVASRSTKPCSLLVSPTGLFLTLHMTLASFHTEGGMTLYLKAGADGKSVGDCPFAHFVRIVLEEKGLEYDLKPSVQETKPAWLMEFYEGKMPALRHRKECYVESDVIAEYLDFFFKEPALKVDKVLMDAAEDAVEGLFPSIAKYLKHTPDGDAKDAEKKTALEQSLQKLNTHLASVDGPYMTGHTFSLVDCNLAPKLYHMKTGVDAFKTASIDFETQFPAVDAYMKAVFDRPSFQKTVYPAEVVTWGWGNARS